MNPAAGQTITTRADDAVARFTAGWDAGQPLTVERFLAESGEPQPDEDDLFELIYTEIVRREQAGEWPTQTEYRRRFPAHGERIGRLFEVHEAVRDANLPGMGAGNGETKTGADAPTTFGRYEVLEEVGRGGMGIVYRARQIDTERIVALKVIRSGTFAGEEEARRFQAEVASASKVRHPGLVPIIESGESHGMQFLAMEFIDGTDLAKLVDGGPLESDEAARLIMKVAEALHEVHRAGIIHRDLKPHNVLLDAAGQPRLTDFGVARLIDQETRLTSTGQIIGTPGFMPPEQVSGKQAGVDERSDIYALGGVLYFLLTGRAPFAAKDTVGTLLNTVVMDVVPPRTLNPRVDPRLERICLNCLEKAPENRYGSAMDLADDLVGYLAGGKARTMGRSGWQRAFSFMRRHAILLFAAAVTLGLVTALVVLSNRYRESLTRINERDQRDRYNLQLIRAGELCADDPQTAVRLLDDQRYCPASLRDFTWRYLHGLATANHDDPQPISPDSQKAASTIPIGPHPTKRAKRQPGRTGPSIAVAPAFSSDGRSVAVVGENAGVYVFDVESHRRLGRFETAGRPVGLVWSKAGEVLYAVCTANEAALTIHTWQPTRPNESVVTSQLSGTFLDVATREPILLLRDSNGRVLRFDITNGKQTSVAQSAGAAIAAAKSDRVAIASVGDEGSSTITIHAGESKTTPIGTLHRVQVSVLQFSPDGKRLFAGTETGRILAWDCSTRRLLWSRKPRAGRVHSLDLSPDGRCLAVRTATAEVLLLDPITGDVRCRLASENGVAGLRFAPDGRRLVQSNSRSLRIWTARDVHE